MIFDLGSIGTLDILDKCCQGGPEAVYKPQVCLGGPQKRKTQNTTNQGVTSSNGLESNLMGDGQKNGCLHLGVWVSTSFSTDVPRFPHLFIHSDMPSPHANDLRFIILRYQFFSLPSEQLLK